MWVKYLQITPDRVYYKCKGNTDWTYYAELGASCLCPQLCFFMIIATQDIWNVFDFSFDLDLCVVGRFACFVPTPSPTRTVIPESFFGWKIIEENFLLENPWLELAGIALRVNFIMGRKQVKRTADLLS